MPEQKQKTLTIVDRLEILQRPAAGESRASVTLLYGISRPAISCIKRNNENLLKQKRSLNQNGGNAPKKKKRTGIEEAPLEKALYEWFVEKRAIDDPVPGHLLQEKARQFNELLNGPGSFVASDGFSQRFKKRHLIRCLSIPGENLSADVGASGSFLNEIHQHLCTNEFTMDRVYNADETGLYWKMLPDETLVGPNEAHASDRKVLKDRVTLVVCDNASGTHKIPLMVIGKVVEPRCLKNIDPLPTLYMGQKNARMDPTVMQEWYEKVFLPEIQRVHGASGKKCILLLDNAPSHPPAEILNSLSNVCEVKFLPPNVTSSIQPMGQGVIVKVKKVYKIFLLRVALTESSSEAVEKLLRSLTLLDCCNLVAPAWDEVTELDIRNSWKNLFPSDIEAPANDVLEANTYLEIARRLPNRSELSLNDIGRWLRIDNGDPGWRVISDDELVTGIPPEETGGEHEEESTSDSAGGAEHSVSTKDVFGSLQNVLKWCKSNAGCEKKYCNTLNMLKNEVLSQIINAQ